MYDPLDALNYGCKNHYIDGNIDHACASITFNNAILVILEKSILQIDFKLTKKSQLLCSFPPM